MDCKSAERTKTKKLEGEKAANNRAGTEPIPLQVVRNFDRIDAGDPAVPPNSPAKAAEGVCILS